MQITQMLVSCLFIHKTHTHTIFQCTKAQMGFLWLWKSLDSVAENDPQLLGLGNMNDGIYIYIYIESIVWFVLPYRTI